MLLSPVRVIYDRPDSLRRGRRRGRCCSVLPTPAFDISRTVAGASYQTLTWEAARRTHVEYFWFSGFGLAEDCLWRCGSRALVSLASLGAELGPGAEPQ